MWVQPQHPLSQAVPSVGCPGSAERRICQCWSWPGWLPPLLPGSPGAGQGQPRCPFLPADKQPLFQAPEQNPAPSQLPASCGQDKQPAPPSAARGQRGQRAEPRGDSRSRGTAASHPYAEMHISLFATFSQLGGFFLF